MTSFLCKFGFMHGSNGLISIETISWFLLYLHNIVRRLQKQCSVRFYPQLRVGSSCRIMLFLFVCYSGVKHFLTEYHDGCFIKGRDFLPFGST